MVDTSFELVPVDVGVGVTDGDIWLGQCVKVLLLWTAWSLDALCLE